ncbi:MAG: PadR family transcriptional regulator [Gemmatimonadetes bacterium]|nr:PadR family transcriptional regulator [Gemmatimonadota bacterium]MBT8402726.1 PadR family transcriptional regulator [Gemmatimonadota bacterium]NNF37243.1 helix-turn-helix transcriptional regulator [Gemmatimonadota bacterium]
MESTPLKPHWFQVLLALSEGPRHGFAIRDAVEERTAGGMVLWPATLYGVLRDLADAGWIQELGAGEAPDADARRKYYELTAAGRDRLLDEARRLEGWAAAARAGLRPEES